MSNIGLFYKVRRKRKISKIKNTNVKINDLINRDYDNLFHDETILATDVTYINYPYSGVGNHVYLSAIYNHKTKAIESYKLSKYNDMNLVIDSIKRINISNVIIHSDHGSIYSSSEFRNLVHLKKMKAINI